MKQDHAQFDVDALEYRSDDGFEPVRLRFEGDEHDGWRVLRGGEEWLTLGPGYRALETAACGICSTDLDRRFLPFRLPQVTGHEIVARDHDGQRVAVEINASPHARRVSGSCVDCEAGLARHCVQRLVLGIHDLPGGFGPRVLAPTGAIVPIPDHVPDDTAVLIEPFAAALRAVERVGVRAGERVAVLGPRRLGMLVIAALDEDRRRRGIDVEISALVRRAELGVTATVLGADRFEGVLDGGRSCADGAFDVVIDTTADPAGFALACRLASREVHLKSTHGQEAGGIARSTAMVVDEISVEPFDPERPCAGPESRGRRPRVAWASSLPVPAAWAAAGDVSATSGRGADALLELRDELGALPGGCVVGADVVVVDDLATLDVAVRPSPADELGLARPCGTIAVTDNTGSAPLSRALARGVRLGTSRCGDFRRAIERIANDRELLRLGETMITHRFQPADLEGAFRTARSPACLKAVIEHR